MDKSYKIKVNACFYCFPVNIDLNKWSYFGIRAKNNSVAAFQAKLFEILDISSPDYSAAFHRGDFDVGDKLNAEDELDDGAIVFIVVTCRNSTTPHIGGKFYYKQGGKF